MPVLKTTSPEAETGAPKETPWIMVPSSRWRVAYGVVGVVAQGVVEEMVRSCILKKWNNQGSFLKFLMEMCWGDKG